MSRSMEQQFRVRLLRAMIRKVLDKGWPPRRSSYHVNAVQLVNIKDDRLSLTGRSGGYKPAAARNASGAESTRCAKIATLQDTDGPSRAIAAKPRDRFGRQG